MAVADYDRPADEPLPVCRVAELQARAHRQRWLVEGLWAEQAVGILGGAPKLGKSWLGLDLAVSVASATPCLDRFPVTHPGPTLIYLAEDALPLVKERIAGICDHRHLAIEDLDLYAITATDLRLDQADDRNRLDATLRQLRPRLLVLDPLVRLHRLDENSAADLSGLLGYLRTLQRNHGVAIVLVHHMSKRGRTQLGNALRGSSDLFAFGDSYAYLTRAKDRLLLTLEHRSAAAPNPIALQLSSRPDGTATHLAVAADQDGAAPAATPPLDDRVLAELRRAGAPRSRVALRTALRVNNNRLGDALVALERDRRIRRTPGGWQLEPRAADDLQLSIA